MSPAVIPADSVFLDGGLDERRRRAHRSALDRLGVGWSDAGPDAPRAEVVPFGPGAAVVALAGAFDRAAAPMLRELTEQVERLARAELVVDMSRTTACDGAAARVVARWRIRRVAAAAAVELHGAPPALRAELGQHATLF
jgi:ABC-type transporter Mla MlaB component